MRHLWLSIAALVLLVECAPDLLPGYRAATADERTSIFATVSEYYDILDRAMVSGDAAPLYVRHPRLQLGEERQHGVNTEGTTVFRTRELALRAATIDMEFYEPLRVFLKGDVAVAYSHGLFTWTYANGSETKGEMLVRFDLARAGERWMIERSDEWVLGEGAPSPTPR